MMFVNDQAQFISGDPLGMPHNGETIAAERMLLLVQELAQELGKERGPEKGDHGLQRAAIKLLGGVEESLVSHAKRAPRGLKTSTLATIIQARRLDANYFFDQWPEGVVRSYHDYLRGKSATGSANDLRGDQAVLDMIEEGRAGESISRAELMELRKRARESRAPTIAEMISGLATVLSGTRALMASSGASSPSELPAPTPRDFDEAGRRAPRGGASKSTARKR